MALTDDEIQCFDGPSVWGESDCRDWILAITDLPRPESSIWDAQETEARALVHARQAHGSYTGAVLQWIQEHGYRHIGIGSDLAPGDVVIIRDEVYGELPAGVGSGATLLIRHPHGLAVASGTILHHLRRG